MISIFTKLLQEILLQWSKFFTVILFFFRIIFHLKFNRVSDPDVSSDNPYWKLNNLHIFRYENQIIFSKRSHIICLLVKDVWSRSCTLCLLGYVLVWKDGWFCSMFYLWTFRQWLWIRLFFFFLNFWCSFLLFSWGNHMFIRWLNLYVI